VQRFIGYEYYVLPASSWRWLVRQKTCRGLCTLGAQWRMLRMFLLCVVITEHCIMLHEQPQCKWLFLVDQRRTILVILAIAVVLALVAAGRGSCLRPKPCVPVLEPLPGLRSLSHCTADALSACVLCLTAAWVSHRAVKCSVAVAVALRPMFGV
jgi:hypothetical protein